MTSCSPLDVSIIFEAPITVMEEMTPKKITELVQLEVNKIVQNVIKLNVEIPQNVENSKNDLINQLNNLSSKIDNLRSEIQVPTTSNSSNDINRLIEQSVNDNVRELSRELRSQYNIFRKQIEETIKTDQSFVEENLEAFSQYTFDRDRIFKQINDLSGKIDEYESILGNLLVNEKIEEINQNIYLIAQKFDDKFKEVANDLRGLQKPDYMDSEE
jgi:membrane-associated HD superfamily phosphohydrolase